MDTKSLAVKVGLLNDDFVEALAQLLAVAAERDELRRRGDDLVAAMKRSVDVGCTDHLDCAPDGGQFWYDAIKMWGIHAK